MCVREIECLPVPRWVSMSSPGGILLKTELAAPNPHPISFWFSLLIPIPGPGWLVPGVHIWTGIDSIAVPLFSNPNPNYSETSKLVSTGNLK